MLAHRLATILPAMSLAKALDTTRIHRVAGLTGARTAVVTTRPCQAPHHISGQTRRFSSCPPRVRICSSTFRAAHALPLQERHTIAVCSNAERSA